MVEFRDLHISQDGQNLIIDVAIPDVHYYEDEEEEVSVTLGDIYIVNQDTYKDTGSYKAEGEHIWHIEVPEGLKRFRTSLTNREICNLDTSLLFVIAEADGEPTSDTPCGLDEPATCAAIYHKGDIMQRFMHAIKTVERTCEIPKDYIDHMLRLSAVDMAIESAHYAQAAYYWRKYIMPPMHMSPHHFHANEGHFPHHHFNDWHGRPGEHQDTHVHDDPHEVDYISTSPHCSSCHGDVHFH